MKHKEPTIMQDECGRWWIALPVPSGLYETTHGVRKRRKLPVPKGAPRSEAEAAARRIHGKE